MFTPLGHTYWNENCMYHMLRICTELFMCNSLLFPHLYRSNKYSVKQPQTTFTDSLHSTPQRYYSRPCSFFLLILLSIHMEDDFKMSFTYSWSHVKFVKWSVTLSCAGCSIWNHKKPPPFSRQYLRNRSNLDIGVLGYISIL